MRRRTAVCARLLAVAAVVAAVGSLVVTPAGRAGASGLVAAYSFDEGAGSTVTDASGNGNNGTLTNTTWTTGEHGGALSFDGTDSMVTVPEAASLDLTSTMTLEAWVDPAVVTSAWRDVIYKANDAYYLEATSTSAAVPAGGGVIGGTHGEAHGTAALTTGSWAYLAMTYDGSDVRLYVNGTLVGTTSHTGGILTSNGPLQIGGDDVNGQFFDGAIDDVRVYNTALSTSQVQTDMNTPVGGGNPGAFILTPERSELTPAETQQFTAGASVTWSVDNVPGGNTTTGTITSGGLYTAPAAAGTYTVTATTVDGTQAASATVYVSDYAGTFTFHNDNKRTGQNLGETILTPSNVDDQSFGKLFSVPLDGEAISSPLYAEHVQIGGRPHNVVYVATEHDSVYAYDADSGDTTPLWRDSFIDPADGVTTVPAGDTGECCDIAPEIGITSTPVIDPTTNTMYVVAATKEVSGATTTYVQRLHALDLSTGQEKDGGPVVIQASVPGTGIDASGGVITFNPLRENQRTGLLLLNGHVYFGFSSHGDHQPYHGWILGYDAATLQQTLAYSSSADSDSSGIWGDGGGLASDGTDLFFITGDGPFDLNSGGTSAGDSYVRMSTGGTILDYFSPFNQSDLNLDNHDLGSGGTLLLPDQPGSHAHLMVSAGKDAAMYLVDRDDMGHYDGTTNTNVQTLENIFPNGSSDTPGNFSSPVYYDGDVFFGAQNEPIEAFQLDNGLLPTSPTLSSAAVFGDRSATLAVSASGPSSNGIVWAVQRNDDTLPGVLYAFDPAASNGGVLEELYDSSQAGSRDTDDVAAKFSVPLVANGRVYLAGLDQLTVYGLLPSSVQSSPTGSGGGGGGGGTGGGGGSGGGGTDPDLHVALTASATTAPAVGSELDYFVTVSVTNVGSSSDARLSLSLPAGYTVSKTYADRGPGCTGSPPTLTCDVAWISPGTSTHVQIFGTVGQAGEQDATATVTSLLEPELNPADNTMTLKLMPPQTTGGGGGGSGSGTTTLADLKAPGVKGSARPGLLLHGIAPLWNEKPTRVHFDWQLCRGGVCRAIAGAVSKTLRVRRAWLGRSVRFVVAATAGSRTLVVYSPKIAVRKPA